MLKKNVSAVVSPILKNFSSSFEENAKNEEWQLGITWTFKKTQEIKIFQNHVNTGNEKTQIALSLNKKDSIIVFSV